MTVPKTYRLNRREFISLAGMAAAGLLAPGLGMAGKQPTQRPPNIILIMADDLGYCDTNLYECRDVQTPHIQSIAKNGVTFTDGHVTAPLCSPSRAGMITGRYQNRFGFEHNVGGFARAHREGLGLPVSELTIADHLKQAGYTTAAIGKWHLGTQPQFHPLERGFDEFFGFLHGANLYMDPSHPDCISFFRKGVASLPKDVFTRRRRNNPILRGKTPVQEFGYLTDAFTREALDFIERKKDVPFFLYLPYNAPHTPLQATRKHYDRFSHIREEHRRIFAAMVSAVDDGVGAIQQKLKETGIEQNTMLIFLSDNGCAMYTQACSNDPLREGKLWLLEGGTRVPFAIQYPAALPAGLRYRHPISSLDLLPTAVRLAGAQLPGDRKLDGVNLIPYLNGKNTRAPHDILFCRNGYSSSVRKGRWKLFSNRGRNWLFDLKADITEQKNLVTQRPDILRELLEDYRRWETEMVKPLWPPKKEIPASLDNVGITLCV